MESERTYWRGHKLNFVADEPMIVSMLKYRQNNDRTQCLEDKANLISSHVRGTKMHMPILDLDFPHHFVETTKPGHHHLFLDVPIQRWRMFLLLFAMRQAGMIEKGFFLWSLRRGGTFVRKPGVKKTPDEFIRAETPPKFGVLWKLRRR